MTSYYSQSCISRNLHHYSAYLFILTDICIWSVGVWFQAYHFCLDVARALVESGLYIFFNQRVFS